MRFAYIDSQGNEVSIPSVDALALRIELGAIGPDTELYDAQADRWGPAQTHEIFHTLSRDVGGEAGFVAPPPPVASEPPLAAEPEAGDLPEPESLPEPEPEPEEEGPSFDFTGPLTLEGEGAEEAHEAPVPPAVPGGDDDLGFGLDLTLAEGVGPETPAMDLTPEAPPAPPPAAPKEEESMGFDFGDGLELAPEPFEAPEPEPQVGGTPAEPSMDFGSGSAFGEMEMETPLSDFSPEAPPAWMEQDGPTADDGAMSFGGGKGGEEESSHASGEGRAAAEDHHPRHERPKREPKNRPSPPKRARSKAPVGILLGVVALAAVGAGGYYGWTALQNGGGSPASTPVLALPPVTIPDIPAEFLPLMRDLGEAALAGTLDELRALQASSNMPAEPNQDWLAGVYLANASQFRDVQEFWEGIETYVDQVREVDTRIFHDQYVAQLEAAGVVGDTARMLLERADSGFLATREDRFEAYRLMDDLVIAALDLHAFLLRNESNIEYDPAAGGVSRDPVLEAVPNSRELGNEMWGMVDRITGALDALGTLDRVTTERLTAVLFDRIRRAGLQ